MKWLLPYTVVIMFSWTVLSGEACAADAPFEIARMKVTIMPEYDSPATLVIEEGKFADKGRFPAKVTFNLPSEITRLTDVCSLSPGGHHFCQLYEIKSGVGKNFIEIRLPYADFFIDYQYAPYTVAPNSVRSFVYNFDPTYLVRKLEVHIQHPARSTEFSVTPAGTKIYEKEGLTYEALEFENVKAGVPIPFTISYFKAGVAPSVEEAFSAMKTPNLFEGSTGEWLLAIGVIVLGGIAFLRRRRRGRSIE